ncbi:MAG TPA: hypothetical protein VGQ38_14770 [Gaiellaceae bacterium]|jgi:hypothetical protein|nr:hypothetical protein [Gaiellaceae bacterium]
MTRGRILALAVVAVTVVVCVVAAVFVLGWRDGKGGTYAPRHIAVHTAVTPDRSVFGQPIQATVAVTVDPNRVDPSSVQEIVDFRPFAVRSDTETRSRIGRAIVLTHRYTLQCVVFACVPFGQTGRSKGTAKTFQLKSVTVKAKTSDGRAVQTSGTWPPLGVQSRLTEDDLALSEPAAVTTFHAPAVTWRFTPALIAGGAGVLALVLLLGAGVLIGSLALADGRPLHVLRLPKNMSPVERALRLAEHATAHGETDESRKALERLAAELRRKGETGHADDAERLAWSSGSPTTEGVAVLADSVRTNGAR